MRFEKKDIAAAILFVALMIGFVLVINMVTSSSGDQEIRLVEDAVRNAALTCYAVEGAYPDDLEYLRENYHLAYNEEKYVVSYDAFASNLMPSISVTERGKRDL